MDGRRNLRSQSTKWKVSLPKVTADLRKSLAIACMLLATSSSAGVGITATPEKKNYMAWEWKADSKIPPWRIPDWGGKAV